jgi:Cu/Ag efflux pump CusA
VAGVGEVTVSGSALPAVRVEVNPLALFKYGIGLEDVRAALATTNTNGPKGFTEDAERRFQIYTNSQASKAAEYRDLLIAYRGDRAVHLADVATVEDSVEDVRTTSMVNGQVAVQIQCTRLPGANEGTTQILNFQIRGHAPVAASRADIPSCNLAVPPADYREAPVRTERMNSKRGRRTSPCRNSE